MKRISFFILLLVTSLFVANRSFAQTRNLYKLPNLFKFDHQVIQVLSSQKNGADVDTLYFFYNKSSDYAAVRMRRKAAMSGNLFIVLTRDGTSIVFDEHNKNITIVNILKLASELYGLSKWVRMDSLMANIRRKTDGKEFQSSKTGNSAQVGAYTSEEYAISDSRGHKGSVWCAKVDFGTPGDYFLGATGANFLNMMSSQLRAHPLLQALTQPMTLITEIDLKDSAGGKGIDLQTVGISPVSTTVSTTGYTINNYSDMTMPEIFRAEMKKRNK